MSMIADLVPDLLVAVLLLLGGAFVLIGSWGLARLPTTMERLHGPTKATTLGLGAMLLASAMQMGAAHELLIVLFLFLTAPVAANMIAKVHLLRLHVGEEAAGIAGPPPRADGGDWATTAAPRADAPGTTAER